MSRPEWVQVPRTPTYQMAEAMGVKWEAGDGFPRRWAAALDAAPRQPVTAAVGWAVVGPEGVELVSPSDDPEDVMQMADEAYLTRVDGVLGDGYRLARVRIEVIEESDDE